MHRIAFVLLALTSTASANETADIKACNAGKAAKCEALAESYLEKDAAQSLRFLEKACKAKSSRACNNSGAAWSEGKDGATAVDHNKARGFYERACAMKNGLGCFNLGNLFRLGEGVPVDLKLAFASFKKACDVDEAKGCTELGVMHYEGKATKKDPAMALTILEKGCKLGSEPACKNVDILKKLPKP